MGLICSEIFIHKKKGQINVEFQEPIGMTQSLF